MANHNKPRPQFRRSLPLVALVILGFVVLIGSVRGQGSEPLPPLRTAPPDLPRFTVLQGSGNSGEGYIFMSPFSFGQVGREAAYLLILDNHGEPVYYHRFDRLPNAMDFKRHANGQLTYYDRIKGEFIILNNQYEINGSYAAGNGYTADLHDIQLLDNGHVLLLIYDQRVVDMSEIVAGGQPEALVTGCIIQELDAQANVVFQWSSWDHIDILDGDRDFTAARINYMNCNSIERDYDGHLLLSSRNMDEITKINHLTGALIWRMGGKKNEFSFTNDNGFSRQHDARRLANGHMTVYDNGVKNDPARSRGLEIAVDEANKTVTVVREFRITPDAYAGAMGNVQRLPNGNTVVGWGASFKPVFTEFDDQGNKILELSAVSSRASYRAFRFPWHGYPTWPPALVVHADGQDASLYFSWNGSTETSGYMIFAEHENGGEFHVTNVDKAGFENSYVYSMPEEGIWKFRVVALDNKFQPLKSSEKVTVLAGGRYTYLPVTAAPKGK